MHSHFTDQKKIVNPVIYLTDCNIDYTVDKQKIVYQLIIYSTVGTTFSISDSEPSAVPIA